MDSLNINKTVLNNFQCGQCTGNSTAQDILSDQDPMKLIYILLLISIFAFFTLVVMYWHISSRQKAHSLDPYHQYIVGTWKKDCLIQANKEENSASLTIENQTVIQVHPRPEPGPSTI